MQRNVVDCTECCIFEERGRDREREREGERERDREGETTRNLKREGEREGQRGRDNKKLVMGECLSEVRCLGFVPRTLWCSLEQCGATWIHLAPVQWRATPHYGQRWGSQASLPQSLPSPGSWTPLSQRVGATSPQVNASCSAWRALCSAVPGSSFLVRFPAPSSICE
jgi:hypothetical protein